MTLFMIIVDSSLKYKGKKKTKNEPDGWKENGLRS